jgi:formylglycine-generating enzyme required for sulfatase activity
MGCSLEGKQCPVTELPRHEVTITKPFEIGKFKVTKKEWLQVMGPTASVLLTDKSDDFPVHAVRWTDVQAFLQTLNEMQDGYAYRLPTEAEWEYAARAGVSEQRYGDLDSIGWHRGNSGNSLHPVGQKLPNAWGLYDVIGNSTEWVADWYGPYESHSQKDPVGPSKAICLLADRRDGTPCDYRVLRGSLANEGPVDSTLSHRSFEHQSAGAMIFTFRYVREATASKR